MHWLQIFLVLAHRTHVNFWKDHPISLGSRHEWFFIKSLIFTGKFGENVFLAPQRQDYVRESKRSYIWIW